MFMLVRNFVNMYIHVCTMYRDVCTDLPILVQVVRIPDVSPLIYKGLTGILCFTKLPSMYPQLQGELFCPLPCSM